MHDPYAVIARFYDRAMADHVADITFFTGLAESSGATVLELATGTGRVAVPLAEEGFTVTGIDTSPAMLALARERATAAGVAVEWLHASMESLRLDGRFDLIFCACDSFLHLATTDAQLAALNSARALLAPNGVLALDLPTLASWSDWQPGVRPLELLWTEHDPERDLRTCHYASYQMHPAQQARHVTNIFEEVAADGSVRRWVSDFDLRFVGRYELEYLLQRAGLRPVAWYGDYELGPLTSASERMIVLAAAGGEE